jgi:uncharacterized heparinase superfamily protein
MLASFARYYHTVRHLRPVQVYGRVWQRLRRPAVDASPAPPRRMPEARFILPARRRASLISPLGFRFLNEEHPVRIPADWDNPAWPKLWRYNLHYFDDLNAWNAAECRDWHLEWLVRWLGENPSGQGTAWEPYPISLRVVNWIKWLLAGNELPEGGLHSLAVQVRYLRERLEFHLLGNHLFANAKALVFAGLFFEGPEADTWLDQGLTILDRELGEQILPDGGQFERSPMYHALALEDLLDLVNLGRCCGGIGPERLARWTDKIGPMRAWLAALSHPDGRIAFFNDAAHGIAPDNRELERYAAELGFPPLVPLPDGIHRFPHSGYIRVQRGDLAAILDVAPLGPSYLPGHAHADTLSFELSWRGRRVVVNGGTSRYGIGPERLAERGTATHSTVAVDGQDSSEVWGGFRVARRARPFGLAVDKDGSTWTVACSHDGYARLPGRPIHRRTWRFGENGLRVEDEVSGRHGRAMARFHLPPELDPRATEDGYRLAPGITLRVERGSHRLGEGTYAPEFGLVQGNRVVEVELQQGKAAVVLEFEGREAANGPEPE